MAPPTPHNLVPQQMPGGGIQVQVNEMVTAQVAMPGQPLVVYNVPGQPQQHAPVPAVHYQQAFAQPPPGIATHQQMFQGTVFPWNFILKSEFFCLYARFLKMDYSKTNSKMVLKFS